MALTDAERGLVDGTAWEDFCDRLKEVGNHVTRSDGTSDRVT